MNKRFIVKSVLWFFAAFGATCGILRLISGLGATTALSDITPWGFWIGFDVMAGVALAAGGFVLAGAVYIFHLERYRPILRATVLTAFLGYLIVALGLIFDLGVPWHIWHPMIFWQHNSVLFEVAMCVMLYLTVLSLEVAPAVLEHPFFQHSFFQAVYRFLKVFTVPLVILGIMLSTLHQSSLGSLFLIMPFRTHVLWYSDIIYVLYFISAIGLGCAMIIFESTITGLLYDHKPKLNLLQGLGKASSVVLGIYFLIRVIDLTRQGLLPVVFNGTWQSNLFIGEILLSTIIPIVLFNVNHVRKHLGGLLATSFLVILGFIVNRQNILITMVRPEGTFYFPSVGEIGLSLGLVSGAALVFFFFIENFNIFQEKPDAESLKEGTGHEQSKVLIGTPSMQKSLMILLIPVVFGIGAAFGLLPTSAIHGFSYPATPVAKAVGWDTLKIDGNRAKEKVMFPHQEHTIRLGQKRDSCRVCHHISAPCDGPTSCFQCHSDMYLEKSIFNHELHQQRLGQNKSCNTCHPAQTKAKEEVKSCANESCHSSMFPADTSISYMAISYYDAMHERCEACHKEKAQENEKPELGYCNACHNDSLVCERN